MMVSSLLLFGLMVRQFESFESRSTTTTEGKLTLVRIKLSPPRRQQRDHDLAGEAIGFRYSHQAAKQESTCSDIDRAREGQPAARRAGDVILNLRAIARV